MFSFIQPENKIPTASSRVGNPVPPRSSAIISLSNIDAAVEATAAYLYMSHPALDGIVSDKTPEQVQRNFEIARRYLGGESSSQLAKEFGVSVQRIWQIVQSQAGLDTDILSEYL